jgi:hypothetical protein
MDNYREQTLLQTVLAKAQEFGIPVELTKLKAERNGGTHDAQVRIGRGAKARIYVVEVKIGLRPATLGAALHHLQKHGKPPLLIADYITPPLADTLKAQGVAFLDAAGNAFVNQPPLYVWVKGEKPLEPRGTQGKMGRAFQVSGLKVLLALLCHPEWVDLPYRDLARQGGVAHGTIGWVMADLIQLGYVAEMAGQRRLLQPERLLKQWAEAYARTLRPKLVLGRYRTDKAGWWTTLQPNRYHVQLSGEPAAERLTKQLRAGTVTLYAKKVEPRLLLDFRLRQDPRGPIELLQRFWTFESEVPQVVPFPVIYADLLVIGDARCLEAAQLIYEKILDRFIP